jgi:hypothetical protein
VALLMGKMAAFELDYLATMFANDNNKKDVTFSADY